METVHVNASKSYDIKISKGILSSVGHEVLSLLPKTKRVAVISDDKVFPLYGEMVTKSLSDSGFDTVSYVFPNGEHSKNTDTLVNILNFLGTNGLTRSDCLIALGGGVVGDITGFAAAVFLRGIHFVQIPTTLLAMVDSSVGGKTAVNHACGKNLAGAFYQPELVLCDTDVLSSLSHEDYADGCAEIIKYAMIKDKELFDFISQKHICEDHEFVIRTCISIKARIVENDEFDNGERQLLNFGHTIGHAVEKCSNYSIHHGSAVAIGMVMMSKGAYLAGLCDKDYYPALIPLLKKYSLPTAAEYTPAQLYNVTLSDKKRSGADITLVLPQEIGKCILKKLPAQEVLNILEKGS